MASEKGVCQAYVERVSASRVEQEACAIGLRAPQDSRALRPLHRACERPNIIEAQKTTETYKDVTFWFQSPL